MIVDEARRCSSKGVDDSRRWKPTTVIEIKLFDYRAIVVASGTNR